MVVWDQSRLQDCEDSRSTFSDTISVLQVSPDIRSNWRLEGYACRAIPYASGQAPSSTSLALCSAMAQSTIENLINVPSIFMPRFLTQWASAWLTCKHIAALHGSFLYAGGTVVLRPWQAAFLSWRIVTSLERERYCEAV